MENLEKQTKRIFIDETGYKLKIQSYADSDMSFEALNRKYVYLNMEQLKELRKFINNHIAIHESMKMVNGVKFSFPLHTPEIGDVFSSSIPAVIQRKEYDELRMKVEDFNAMKKDRDQLLEKVENLENQVEILSNRSESWEKATSKARDQRDMLHKKLNEVRKERDNVKELLENSWKMFVAFMGAKDNENVTISVTNNNVEPAKFMKYADFRGL